MNFLQKTSLFLVMFLATTALAVADSNMSNDFGHPSVMDLTQYARTATKEARQLGRFYGRYYQELKTAVLSEWDRVNGRGIDEEQPSVSAFQTQSL